jgi:hypothetical protein
MDVKLVPTNGCASIFALAIGEVEANGDVGEVHTRELSYFSRLSQASEFNRQSPVEVFRRTTTESRRQRRVLKSLKQLQAGETLSAPVSTCRVQLQNSEDAAQKKPAKVRAKSLYKPAAGHPCRRKVFGSARYRTPEGLPARKRDAHHSYDIYSDNFYKRCSRHSRAWNYWRRKSLLNTQKDARAS